MPVSVYHYWLLSDAEMPRFVTEADADAWRGFSDLVTLFTELADGFESPSQLYYSFLFTTIRSPLLSFPFYFTVVSRHDTGFIGHEPTPDWPD